MRQRNDVIFSLDMIFIIISQLLTWFFSADVSNAIKPFFISFTESSASFAPSLCIEDIMRILAACHLAFELQ